jgi:hypothetical protein
LATTVQVKETAKASVQQALTGAPAVTKNSEDVLKISKPHERQIDTAEFRVNAANVATKKPCKFEQVGRDQCDEVKVIVRSAIISEWSRLFNTSRNL